MSEKEKTEKEKKGMTGPATVTIVVAVAAFVLVAGVFAYGVYSGTLSIQTLTQGVPVLPLEEVAEGPENWTLHFRDGKTYLVDKNVRCQIGSTGTITCWFKGEAR